MVEHLFCKQAVAGSNPIAGSNLSFHELRLADHSHSVGPSGDSAAKAALHGLGEGGQKSVEVVWCDESITHCPMV